MQTGESHPPQTETTPRNPSMESWTRPSSSRMLTTYLADVERMLEEHRWEVALRDASDLPRIAVALTDPLLRSSRERCQAWCARWIHQSDAERESGLDANRIGRLLAVQAEEDSLDSEGVPSLALRRLRLRRHARNPPRGFKSAVTGTADPDEAEAVALCSAVLEGVRRWYSHCACHDATAQVNLARLAVLR